MDSRDIVLQASPTGAGSTTGAPNAASKLSVNDGCGLLVAGGATLAAIVGILGLSGGDDADPAAKPDSR